MYMNLLKLMLIWVVLCVLDSCLCAHMGKDPSLPEGFGRIVYEYAARGGGRLVFFFCHGREKLMRIFFK